MQHEFGAAQAIHEVKSVGEQPDDKLELLSLADGLQDKQLHIQCGCILSHSRNCVQGLSWLCNICFLHRCHVKTNTFALFTITLLFRSSLPTHS